MKIVLLTNILNPFRIYFYDKLYKNFKANGDEFEVLVMATSEPGRTWKYENFERDYTTLLKGKLFKISGISVIINPDIMNKLKSINPDIVVCAGSYMLPSVWVTLAQKKRLDYKVLYWSESHLEEQRSYGNLKLKVREFFRNIVIPKFDGFWFAGQMSKQFIDRYANSSAYYVFVPNLVEEASYYKATLFDENEKIAIKKKFNVNNGNVILLCPARLSKEKGIIEFLQVFKACKYKDNATILMPGMGPLKNKIEELAKEFKVDLRLLGFQDQDSMVELYGCADLFVLPSLSDPNPLSCIEASWASKPLLVSSHVGNNPEVIQQGKNGYVFRYNKPEEAIRIFDKILSTSKEWRKQAGYLSLEIAKNKYNSENVVDRIVEETKKIVSWSNNHV